MLEILGILFLMALGYALGLALVFLMEARDYYLAPLAVCWRELILAAVAAVIR